MLGRAKTTLLMTAPHSALSMNHFHETLQGKRPQPSKAQSIAWCVKIP